jgi:hypothetical protein
MSQVTFKDLQRRVSSETTKQRSRLFERLHNKPFWIRNIDEHRREMSKQTEIAASITLLVYPLKKEKKNQSLIMKIYCTMLF